MNIAVLTLLNWIDLNNDSRAALQLKLNLLLNWLLFSFVLTLSPPVFFLSCQPPKAFLIIFTSLIMAPRIFCCMNIWTCNMSKQRTQPVLYFFFLKLHAIIFIKQNVNKSGENIFVKDTVDHFHQHIQSLHGAIPFTGLTFHSVTLDSFDVYAV